MNDRNMPQIHSAQRLITPDGTETPMQINSAKRCHTEPKGVPQ